MILRAMATENLSYVFMFQHEGEGRADDSREQTERTKKKLYFSYSYVNLLLPVENVFALDWWVLFGFITANDYIFRQD